LDRQQWVAGEVHRYYWQDDVNCAATLLTILAELAGMPLHPQAVAAATGLHGAGGFGAQCGLVEGGLMYIGIAAGGRGLPAGETAALCREYAAAFTNSFGSLLCRELRPEGFSADNPPHLCEGRTVDAVMFAIGYMREKGLMRGEVPGMRNREGE
jgi:hypothetical protein